MTEVVVVQMVIDTEVVVVAVIVVVIALFYICCRIFVQKQKSLDSQNQELSSQVTSLTDEVNQLKLDLEAEKNVCLSEDYYTSFALIRCCVRRVFCIDLGLLRASSSPCRRFEPVRVEPD